MLRHYAIFYEKHHQILNMIMLSLALTSGVSTVNITLGRMIPEIPP